MADESGDLCLSAAQRAALRHVREVARAAGPAARSRTFDLLRRAGCTAHAYDEAMACVRAHARVVVHFHPDRRCRRGNTVAEALFADGVFRNQFETGLSSGSRSAFAGGARDGWERILFGGAYHDEAVTAEERPKYGALELVRHPDGPIPRFGSCYLVLRPRVATRTSFTFMGSEDPRAHERLGVIDQMEGVMSALLAEIDAGAVSTPPWPPFRAPTLEVARLTAARLLEILLQLARPRLDPSEGEPGRVLDTVVEAQIHGPVDLRRDVESLVVDPAFAATPTGSILRQLSSRCEMPLHWHRGFRLAVADVPGDFRGPGMPRLAERIAERDGVLDAAIIGTAEAALHDRPHTWQDLGSEAEVSQLLKQLWHVLVHYGAPLAAR
jgi:hypothetical protein